MILLDQTVQVLAAADYQLLRQLAGFLRSTSRRRTDAVPGVDWCALNQSISNQVTFKNGDRIAYRIVDAFLGDHQIFYVAAK